MTSTHRAKLIGIITGLVLVVLIAVDHFLHPHPVPVWYDVTKIAVVVTAIAILIWNIRSSLKATQT